MTVLVEAACETLGWLEAAGWRACVIGGLAVQRWGEPRLTQDVDPFEDALAKAARRR